jgi:hypothetical protein|tara:strand:+ start:2841 stop:3095 length:255 start_codon:yes stop_codon:yes gene_type:complete
MFQMEDINQLDTDISEAFQKKQMDKVCSLYYEAANYFEKKSDIEAACFFYTQALVMALEENHDLKEKIIHKLEKYGRNQDTTLN